MKTLKIKYGHEFAGKTSAKKQMKIFGEIIFQTEWDIQNH